jgi:hypothetical protein
MSLSLEVLETSRLNPPELGAGLVGPLCDVVLDRFGAAIFYVFL